MQKGNLVLYLDNDLDDLELLSLSFAMVPDYCLVTFFDQQEFLAYLHEHFRNVCLVVMDINMPVASGLQVLETIRTFPHLAPIPAVLLSTSRLNRELALAKALGSDILVKPISASELQALPQNLILAGASLTSAAQ